MATVDDQLVAMLDLARDKGCPELTIPPYGGARTLAEQRQLVDKGVSWTLNSRHRVDEPQHQVGRTKSAAVDVAPWVDGGVPWEDSELFERCAAFLLAAAMQLDLRVTWGGIWQVRDLGHFELK